MQLRILKRGKKQVLQMKRGYADLFDQSGLTPSQLQQMGVHPEWQDVPIVTQTQENE